MFGKNKGVLESFRGGLNCSLYFRSDEDWRLAHQLLKVENEHTLGMEPHSQESFKIADAKLNKVVISLYGPRCQNPEYDPSVAQIVLKAQYEQEVNTFNALRPYQYSTEFLRKIHQIVEDELRRRDEEHKVKG